MMQSFYRDTWADIDLDAIRFNMKQMKERYPSPKKVYAVVKANAYGHGDVEVAQAALEAGADQLAVALLDEAVHLRKQFPEVPILILGRIRPEQAPVAAEHNLMVTIFQSEWVLKADQYLNEPLQVHLKIDTGMNRQGIKSADEAYALLTTMKSTSLVLKGVYSHLATADEDERLLLETQMTRFQQYITEFQDYFTEEVEVHLGNSAGAMRFPESMYDAVRFGIGMYGLYPSDLVRDETKIPLKPAFSLQSRLIHIKQIEPNETISYGTTYTAQEKEWIGTVPLGYGDGWIRKLQGFHVLVNGKKYPIVGRVCMDQFMVKLDQQFPVDTPVVIIGEQQGNVVTTDDVARHLETINYEIPCMINQRVPRVYHNVNK
ncbi:alanine racemase [Alkalibacillus salilacus]|uniref:Alanine racemase n=1 Tax=Alkalibacillus salilacus TaxID=284582 RepID=A0ABT9VE55_9BACI|nr:alanine racemase [Alkalibacillus salilacus]MDQ0159224.1 alanine racemase [Alkalibacillus salilacus]